MTVSKNNIATVESVAVSKGKATILVKGVSKGKSTITVKVGKKKAKVTLQIK